MIGILLKLEVHFKINNKISAIRYVYGKTKIYIFETINHFDISVIIYRLFLNL